MCAGRRSRRASPQNAGAGELDKAATASSSAAALRVHVARVLQLLLDDWLTAPEVGGADAVQKLVRQHRVAECAEQCLVVLVSARAGAAPLSRAQTHTHKRTRAQSGATAAALRAAFHSRFALSTAFSSNSASACRVGCAKSLGALAGVVVVAPDSAPACHALAPARAVADVLWRSSAMSTSSTGGTRSCSANSLACRPTSGVRDSSQKISFTGRCSNVRDASPRANSCAFCAK